MREKVLEEFEKIENELIAAISNFNQDQFNVVPFEGSWTAGQVAQHILLSSSSGKVLRGRVKKTTRSPDEHISKLQSIFLDFNSKMNSPEFIIPEERNYDKVLLLAALKMTWSEIKEIIRTSDLSETCLDAPPELGELTRLELIRFISFHTQRHTHQLKNIHSHILSALADEKSY